MRTVHTLVAASVLFTLVLTGATARAPERTGGPAASVTPAPSAPERDSNSCSIQQLDQQATREYWRAHNPVAAARANWARRTGRSVSAYIDGSRVLNIDGTTGDDSARLALRSGDPNEVEIFDPASSTTPAFSFNLADFDSVRVRLLEGDDFIVFDDANGTVGTLRPLDIDLGDGDDGALARTGSLTVQQVLDAMDLLQTARDLATDAQVLLDLMGAVEPLGNSGDNLISNAIAHLQDVHDNFVLPAADYVEDFQTTMIDPAAALPADVRDNLIDQAAQLILTAESTLAQPGLQFKDDAQVDLEQAANALAGQAQALHDQAVALQQSAFSCLQEPGATDLTTQLTNLANLLDPLIDACDPNEPTDPNDTTDVCPDIEDIVDCMEVLIDDFEQLGLDCGEGPGDDLAADADLIANTNLEATGDAYEIRGDNFELTADAFVLQAEAFIAFAETYGAALQAQLQTAGDALETRADTEFTQAGAAFQSDVQTRIGAKADQLQYEASVILTELEQIMLGASGILAGGLDGGEAGADCSNIQTTNTITGGPGPNFLLGTTGNDLIHGQGGLDLIVGSSGDDKLYGDADFDLLFGGPGTNELHGGDGVDILVGGNDNDCLYGEAGFDILVGQGQDDELEGGDYIDLCFGGGSDDVVRGGEGIDLVVGDLTILNENGNDSLYGDNCIDVLIGGNGTDLLIGGAGQTVSIGSNFSIELGDVLLGGPDNDIMHGDDPPVSVNGIDVMLGGGEDDQMFGGNGGDLVIGSFTVKLGNIMLGEGGIDTITSKDGIDVLFGGTGNDTITAGIGYEITLNSGNFKLQLGDLLFGDQDDDTLHGDDPNATERDLDLLFGGSGNDTIHGYDGGNLTINSFTMQIGNLSFGGDNDDTIDCKDGIDLAFGGSGNDTIQCGKGFTFTNQSGTFSLAFGDIIFGMADNDTLHGDQPAATGDPLEGDIDVIFGGNGADSIYGCGGGIIYDFSFTPPIEFTWGDFLFGDPGNDTIIGDFQQLDPNDREHGIDLIFGGADDDTIDAGPGSMLWIIPGGNGVAMNFGNIIFGNAGRDTIDGADDSIPVFGGGMDLAFGGPDDDTIRTGDGIDLVFGNDGDDTLELADGGLIAIVASFVPVPIPLGNLGFGNDHDDTIRSNGRIVPIEVDLLFGNRCEDTIEPGGGLLNLVFGNRGHDTITNDPNEEDAATIDLWFGGPGRDTLDVGGGLLNLAFGGADADVLQGRDAPADILFGNRAGDVINSGDGLLDLVFGNLDNDEINGGGGTANILFGNRNGDHIIAGNAILNVAFGNRDPDWIEGGSGINVLFGNGDADLIETHNGVNLNLAFGNSENDELIGGNFIDLLFGNTDNDHLEGRGGVDLLFGNRGNDCIFTGDGLNLAFGGQDSDVIAGGNDFDVLFGGAAGDVIFGASGTDVIFGNGDADSVYGDSGVDFVFGNKENDTAGGGSGDDFVFGNKHDDHAYGDGDSDFVFGNRDNDYVYAGNDGSRDRVFGNRGDDYVYRCDSNDKRYGGQGHDTKGDDCSNAPGAGSSCGRLGGTKYVDRDGNGSPDGGLAGVTIYLDTNFNGQLDSGEPTTLTQVDNPNTFADETGTYSFSGLSPGTYRINEKLADGLSQQPPAYHYLSLGPAQHIDGLDFFNTDNCRVDASARACDPSGCTLPGRICAATLVEQVSYCALTGRPCTTDDDCDCGDTCVTEWRVVECECIPETACHIEFGAAGPICVGQCPQGQQCELVQQGNQYHCECVPLPPQGADDCENAPQVGPGVYPGTTFGATPNGVSCFGDGLDVWYKFVAPFGGILTVSTCPGASFDTALEIWHMCPAEILIACDDDSCQPGAFLSLIRFPVAQGDTYYICVSAKDLVPGNYTLVLDLANPADGSQEPDAPATDASSSRPASRRFGDGVPNPPGVPPYPHSVEKNRYISFVPTNPNQIVAYEVIIPPCRRAYVGRPRLRNFEGDDPALVSMIVEEPVYRLWTDAVVHVTGCVIVPTRQYEVRALTPGLEYSDPLLIDTVAVWGDVVGTFDGVSYSPPNGVVNEIDWRAVSTKISHTPTAPHVTWVDLAPEWPDYRIDQTNDLAAEGEAMSGLPYPPASFPYHSATECPLRVPCPGLCGDLNCDGVIDFADIDPFVLALSDRLAYQAAYPSCYYRNADVNGDDLVDFGDINEFVELLSGY